MNRFIDTKLNNLLLRDLEFRVNGKIYKKGRLKLYNTKHFYIRFTIEKNGGLKVFEMPYPFQIFYENENHCIFDYCLSAFCPQQSTNFKLKTVDHENCSKMFDNYVHILLL